MAGKPTYEQLEQWVKQLEEEGVRRELAEKALIESEIKHKTLVNNIPGMIYRAYTDWSAEVISGCEKISGYTTDELNSKDKNWLSIIHPDDLERVFNEGSVLSTRQKDLTQTYRIKIKNGEFRWVEDRKTSLFTEEGEFIGIDGVVFDITDRIKSEKALRESEKKYKDLAELLPQLVYEMDDKGFFTFVNLAGIAMSGYTQEDFDNGMRGLEIMHDESMDRFAQDIIRHND